jgi:hydrogenase/urease accessory protein HupE
MALLAAGEALAHPDHGARGWLSADWLHLLSEPDHLAMILAPLAIGLAWIARRAWRGRWRGCAAPKRPGRPGPR